MTDAEALEKARGLIVGSVDPMKLFAVQREIGAELLEAYANGMDQGCPDDRLMWAERDRIRTEAAKLRGDYSTPASATEK